MELKSLGRMTSHIPIGSMYGIYANIGDILMVNVTIYSIHGSYGLWNIKAMFQTTNQYIGLVGKMGKIDRKILAFLNPI